MAWVTIPCLLALREEFNLVNPGRDKGADGTIGDRNHSSLSDHTPDEESAALRNKDADSRNEVHALDIDSTGPWNGVSFDALVKRVIAQEKARWADPDDKCRLQYIIWNMRIYSQTNDFNGAVYQGSDPHTNHAHFSARYDTSCENDVRPWGVFTREEITMADLDDYFESAARACGGKTFDGQVIDPDDISAADRRRRFNLAKILRFGDGVNGPDQNETTTVHAHLNRIEGML